MNGESLRFAAAPGYVFVKEQRPRSIIIPIAQICLDVGAKIWGEMRSQGRLEGHGFLAVWNPPRKLIHWSRVMLLAGFFSSRYCVKREEWEGSASSSIVQRTLAI